MMNLFHITYDLGNSHKYREMEDAIDSIGIGHEPLINNWIIASSESLSGIKAILEPYLDQGDKLLISEISNDWELVE